MVVGGSDKDIEMRGKVRGESQITRRNGAEPYRVKPAYSIGEYQASRVVVKKLDAKPPWPPSVTFIAISFFHLL